jgi:uncharacterized protein (DUF1800 family)
MNMDASLNAALALHRFGVGARLGERAAVGADARGFLSAQTTRPENALIVDPELPSSAQAARALFRAQKAKAAGAAADAPPIADPLSQPMEYVLMSDDPGLVRRAIYMAETMARLRHGAGADAGFVERLVLFWSNHFAVSVDKGPVQVLAGAMEREAIRPHVLGRFADLLKAVEQHPAMLLFLDNEQSIGPDSRVGQSAHKGLNENLARETLELHTLGVDGGYTQADVTAFARVLTGWSWGPPGGDEAGAGEFVFYPPRHEPGPVTIMGRSYAQSGVAQGEAVLDDLAVHPATARHIATKLVVHFVSDDPPPAAVARVEAAFRESGGDLAHVARALFASPEAWAPKPVKLRSPYDFVLAAARAQPTFLQDRNGLFRAFAALGERPWAPPSPKGFEDTTAAWLAPHSFKERLEWASLMCVRHPPAQNPRAIAGDLFGPLLSSETGVAVEQAVDGPQGLTLLMMSPEFQRT